MAVIRNVPLTVDQNGHRLAYVRRDNPAALVWTAAAPRVAVITAAGWTVKVTLEGFCEGLADEWVEPCGQVTLWPHPEEPDWLVIAIDSPEGEAHLTVRGDYVGAFLADVTHAALLGEPDRPREIERDWTARTLRRGGAA